MEEHLVVKGDIMTSVLWVCTSIRHFFNYVPHSMTCLLWYTITLHPIVLVILMVTRSLSYVEKTHSSIPITVSME